MATRMITDPEEPRPMSPSPRFMKPTALHLDAVGVLDDGSEGRITMDLDATSRSDLTVDLTSHTADAPDPAGLYLRPVPTGEHDLTVTITNARLTGPAEAGPTDATPEIDTGTLLYDRHWHTHYTVVRTSEGEPVLRPAKAAEIGGSG